MSQWCHARGSTSWNSHRKSADSRWNCMPLSLLPAPNWGTQLSNQCPIHHLTAPYQADWVDVCALWFFPFWRGFRDLLKEEGPLQFWEQLLKQFQDSSVFQHCKQALVCCRMGSAGHNGEAKPPWFKPQLQQLGQPYCWLWWFILVAGATSDIIDGYLYLHFQIFSKHFLKWD